MDVLGVFGESRNLYYFDDEHVIIVCGNNICTLNLQRGLKSVLIRPYGISAIDVSRSCSFLAAANEIGSKDIEIVDIHQQTTVHTLTGIDERTIGLNFSQDGSKLLSITALEKQTIFVWDIASQIPILKVDLTLNINRIIVDQSDDTRFLLVNDEEIHVGAIKDVFDKKEVQFVPLDQFQSEAPTRVLLVLPMNLAIVVDNSDSIHVINTSTWHYHTFGQLQSPVTGAICRPTVASISMGHILLGTECGLLLWYHYNLNSLINLHTSDDDLSGIFSFTQPIQHINFGASVDEVLVSPSSNIVLVSCSGGKLFSTSSGIYEVEALPEDNGESAEAQVSYVVPHNLILDRQIGAVYFSDIFNMSMSKSDSNTSGVSAVLSLAHDGTLSLWKIPSGDMLGSAGVNAFMSRALKVNCDAICGREGTTITSVCIQTGVRDPLVFLGSIDGFVDAVAIFLEEVDGNSDISDLIEDEGAFYRANFKKVNTVLLSSDPVSYLACDGSGSHLVAGGFRGKSFMVDIVDGNDLFVRGFLAHNGNVVAGAWDKNASTILLTADTGDVLKCRPSDFSSDFNSVFSSTYTIKNGIITSICANEQVFVLPQQSHALVVFQNPFEGPGIDKHRVVEFFSHSDQITCFAISCNNRCMATGSVDGQVYLWRLEAETMRSQIVSKQRFHSDAVISLSFSSDSSYLMSFGSDGSAVLISLTKAEAVEVSMPRNPNLDKILFGNASNANNDIPWIEKYTNKQKDKVKESFKLKVFDLESSITDLSGRVQALIKQNSERSELEQLDRDEFVIDTGKVQTQHIKTQNDIEEIRKEYQNRLGYHEMVAARIKATCFDTMEFAGSKLHTLSDDNSNAPKTLSTFSIKKLSPREQLWLSRVKRLRAIEIRTQRRLSSGSTKNTTSWPSLSTGIPSESMTWIVLEGLRKPTAENPLPTGNIEAAAAAMADAAKSSEGDAEEEEDGQGDMNEVDPNNSFQLLSPPTVVRSRVQKISHLWLLRDVDSSIRKQFNKLFESLSKDRDDAVSQIAGRNTRIQEILTELRTQEALWVPKYTTEVKANSAFKVLPSELTTSPYETQSMRQARIAEEERKRKLAEESSKQDVKGRALQDMMNGTLEVKKNILGDDMSLQRPEWMVTTPLNQMTETQIKELEAFEAKLKEYHDEQANYRKQLEQEMKKLRVEIAETAKAFDDKFNELFEKRMLFQMGLLGQDLYVSNIAASIVKKEYYSRALAQSKQNIESLKIQRNEIKRKVHILQTQIENVRHELFNVNEEEKNLDKSFKKDIQVACNTSFDQETLKILYSLYRIRHFANVEAQNSLASQDNANSSFEVSDAMNSKQTKTKGKSSKVSQSNNNNNKLRESKSKMVNKSQTSSGTTDMVTGPMQEAAKALKNKDHAAVTKDKKNPFEVAHAMLKHLKEQVTQTFPLKTTLDKDNDCPEGFNIDQFSWSKLQELRLIRIEKEIQSKQLFLDISELKSQLDRVLSDEAKIEKSLASVRAQRDHFTKLSIDLETDVNVLISLKQGQDEMVQDAAVTDYAQGILIPKSAVAIFNNRIKELGKEKIAILNKTKLFRRKINSIEWEAKHLQMMANHYNEYFTDLQLLRVTKDLQQILREGVKADSSKAKVDKINSRKEFLQSDAETRMVKLAKTRDAIARQLEERQDELQSFFSKADHLRQQVQARESIKQSKTAFSLDSGKLNDLKMKKIVSRRNLVDTARAQAEEVDNLRQELDNLRQRAFPSFVRATKKRTLA